MDPWKEGTVFLTGLEAARAYAPVEPVVNGR
jgi:hypothetical protein